MLIEDPNGHRWWVHRRWLGLRRPRWRGAEDPGFANLVAIAVAAGVRSAPETGPRGRRIAAGALVLSAAGLLLTALVVLGLVTEHHRVA